MQHRPGLFLGYIASGAGWTVLLGQLNDWFAHWNATLQGMIFLGTLFITAISLWRTIFGKRKPDV